MNMNMNIRQQQAPRRAQSRKEGDGFPHLFHRFYSSTHAHSISSQELRRRGKSHNASWKVPATKPGWARTRITAKAGFVCIGLWTRGEWRKVPATKLGWAGGALVVFVDVVHVGFVCMSRLIAIFYIMLEDRMRLQLLLELLRLLVLVYRAVASQDGYDHDYAEHPEGQRRLVEAGEL